MTVLPEVNGYNTLMVVLDKMGKLSRLVPCRAGENQLTAPEVAKLFFENWVRFFGVPKYVINDRYVRFTAPFWVLVCCLVVLTIHRRMGRPSVKTERSNK